MTTMATRTYQANDDFEASVALGLITKVARFNTVGVVNEPTANIETDISNLVGPRIPLPSNAGEALEIVSDDPADTDIIQIDALGPGGVIIPTFTVVLDGTTPVALPGTISRINGAESVGVDGFDGDLLVRQSGGGTVFAKLAEHEQVMSQCLFTVPADVKMYLKNRIATMQKSTGVSTDVEISIVRKKMTETKFKHIIELGAQREGSSNVIGGNCIPAIIVGPADVKMDVVASAAGTKIAGAFSGYLFSD